MRKDLSGPCGTAFQIDLPPGVERVSGDSVACLSRWNVTIPNQTPLTNRFVVGCITLADLPGVTPAVRLGGRENATHEVVVYAVPPDFPEKNWQEGGIQVMVPVNYVAQFAAVDDAHAIRVCDAAVQMFLDGMMLIEPALSGGIESREGQDFVTYIDMLAAKERA